MKHLEKRGLIEISDSTVASEMRLSACRESKSEVQSDGRRGRSPKTPGEVVHTDTEKLFRAYYDGMRYFLIYVDEASRHERIVALTTHDAGVKDTGFYLNQMLQEGVSVNFTSCDGAGELETSGKCPRMLAKRGMRQQSSPSRASHSKSTANRAISSRP